MTAMCVLFSDGLSSENIEDNDESRDLAWPVVERYLRAIAKYLYPVCSRAVIDTYL